VAVVFTGGTISMRFDAGIGGAVPSLGADEIVAAARGIERVADLRVEEWGRHPGPHMTTERQWALRGRLQALVEDPAIDGVVVTHGTDTIEESAYLATRSIATDKPIVFTGAMRK
jgi:L-asparaginase